MKRFVAFAVVGFVLTTVSGCGSKAERLTKDMITTMHDMADALEKKESPEKIKALAERFKKIGEEGKDLKLTKEEEEKLKKKYEGDIKAAAERLDKAMDANPEGAKAMRGAMGRF